MNWLKRLICGRELAALKSEIKQLKKDRERAFDERDEARMEAVKWKTAACRLAKDKDIYYIGSEQPFTWELPSPYELREAWERGK